MAVYNRDTTSKTKTKNRKTTDAKKSFVEQFRAEAEKRAEEERKRQEAKQKQEKAKQIENERRERYAPKTGSVANFNAETERLRKTGGAYGQMKADARDLIPNAAKMTLDNQQAFVQRTGAPVKNVMERNPAIQQGVMAGASAMNALAQMTGDKASARATQQDYDRAMRNLQLEQRTQRANNRKNPTYRLASDYNSEELSWMAQQAQMASQFESRRYAEAVSAPEAQSGNNYVQNNAMRRMENALKRSDEADARLETIRAAQSYRSQLDKQTDLAGIENLRNDPSFRSQANLGKVRYDNYLKGFDEEESLRRDLTVWLDKDQRENFFALYVTDPERARQYGDQMKWQNYQESLQDVSEFAGKNPLTRIPSWELGRRLGQAAGFTPFSEKGRMMTMAGEALLGGSAQGLQEHGLFNTGLGAGTIDLPVFGEKGLGDVSQILASMANSYENAMFTAGFGALGEGMSPAAAKAIATFGEYIGLALMGSQAAASDYADLMLKGVDQKTAILHATAAGIAEGVFEKLSLDNIIQMGTGGGLKTMITNWFKQKGIEASEEMFTSLANRITDELIMDASGYRSAVDERKHELMMNGMSWQDANSTAEHEWLTEIMNDGLGGWISGGGMTAINYTGAGLNNLRNRINTTNEIRYNVGSRLANNADLTAALNEYAAQNNLAGISAADIETTKAMNERLTKQVTGEQAKSEGQQKQTKAKKRQQTTETKAARRVGKQASAILDNIAKRMDNKTMREYEMDAVSVMEQNKKLRQMVENEAYYRSLELYSRAKDLKTLDQFHADNAKGVKDEGLRNAALNAFQNAAERLADTNDTAARATRTARQILHNGALDLSASYESDGETKRAMIQRFADDTSKVILDNGETRSIEDLDLDQDTTEILQEIHDRELSATNANDVLNWYQMSVKEGDVTSGYAFVDDFISAMDKGRNNSATEAQVVQRYSDLGERAAKAAYSIGRNAALQTAKAAQTQRNNARQTYKAGDTVTTDTVDTKWKGATGREGKVDMSAVKGMTLDAQQAQQIALATGLARALGADVEVIASKLVDGKYVGHQGSYSNGKIQIDINAGRLYAGDPKSGVLKTMSHELTHFIQDYSPEQYQGLKDFAFEILGQKMGMDSFEDLVDSKIARSKNGISRLEAEDEVLADACETMLRDSKAVEQLYKQNATLADNILNWLADFISKVRLNLGPADHEEAKIIDELEKDLRAAFQERWDNALADAAQAHSEIGATNTAEAAAERVGISIDTKTETANPVDLQLSERSWSASEYVRQMDDAAKKLAKALDLPVEQAEKYIKDINSVAYMIASDRARLDYYSAPGLSAFKSNSEYGGSIDFSTLCKKRRLFTGTLTAIQQALPNTALTAADVLALREMMDKAGLEVPCGKCYVEGSRAVMGEFTRRFLDMYEKANPGKWVPNMAQMNTPDGIEWVRQTHPEVYEQYEYFWNHYGTLPGVDSKNLFASQQKPKLYQARTEYNGEVLENFEKDTPEETKKVVDEKNLNGGLRLQSFSDFELVHLIDCMQVIMDMSRVGLYGQAYTKVPEFAKALGKTGLKINLSIDAWGVDKNGKLIFNDKEGMDSKTAFDLRKQFSDNVGTICCVYDDKMLLAALADDRIDFIIPFHRSQWKKSQYKAMGLPTTTKDYTYQQNEKWINPSAHTHQWRGKTVRTKVTNYMPNEYWDFNLTGKQNAEKYLEMCAKDGKRPKFYKFLQNNGDGSYSLKADGSTDGYWKLLIDFKMYNNEGVGVPQQAVKPVFDMDGPSGIKEMLDNYTEEHINYPVAQGVVDEFVEKYKKEHPKTQYSVRSEQMLTEGGDVRKAFIQRFTEFYEQVLNNKGKWQGSELDPWFDGIPEIDFIRDLADDYDNPRKRLREFLSMIDDAKTLERMKWFIPEHTRYSSSYYRGAKQKFRNDIDTRLAEITGGKKISLKRGRQSYDSIKNLFNDLNTDDAVAELAKKVFAVTDKIQPQIYASNDYIADHIRSANGSNGRKSVGFSAGRNVFLRQSYFANTKVSNQTKASTILHELIHCCTSYAIYAYEGKTSAAWVTDDMRSAIEQLTAIYNDAKKEPSLVGMYGMHDMHEFVAELSNPFFRAKMEKVSLLDRIVNAFCKFFGIERKSNVSYLEAASAALDYLLAGYDSHSANSYFYDQEEAIQEWEQRNDRVRYSERDTRQTLDTETSDGEEVRFSLREKPAPKNTKTAYKLMRLIDGNLYPLFIGNNEKIKIGTWYDAESPNLSMLKDLPAGTHMINMETGEAITFQEYLDKYVPGTKRTKPNVNDIHWANDNGYRFMYIEDKAGTSSANRMQKQYGDTRAYYNWGVNGSAKSETGEGSASIYALRPGWHFGEVPSMHQIGYGDEKETRLDNQVWVEVQMAADVDYNDEAASNYSGDIPTHIPVDGYYTFATNPTQKKTKTGTSESDRTKADWYVAGAFTPVRILSDSEADAIVQDYNKRTGASVPLDHRRAGGGMFNADTMRVERKTSYSERDGEKPRSAQAQRDAGYKLSESKFYSLYSAHKLNMVGKENIDEQIANIREYGFAGDGGPFGANLMPSRMYYKTDSNGKKIPGNISVAKYAPKKGDYILLVPKNGAQITKIYDRVKPGWKPDFDYEIVRADYDYQPYYEMYSKAYDQSVRYSERDGDGEYEITIGWGDNRKTYQTDQITAEFSEDRATNEAMRKQWMDGKAKEVLGETVDAYRKYQKGVANKNNYYFNTIANFTERATRPKRNPDYVSYSWDKKKGMRVKSSEYWYTDDGVIRGSDHWGREIASCSWYLNGTTPQYSKRYGYAKFSDFTQITDVVTSEDGKATISTFENTIGSYRKKGSVIPIVRGFNDSISDISKYEGKGYIADIQSVQYSERDESLLSDNRVLIEADESVAQNEEQRRMLREYKEQAKKITKLTEKLQDARQKRRDAEKELRAVQKERKKETFQAEKDLRDQRIETFQARLARTNLEIDTTKKITELENAAKVSEKALAANTKALEKVERDLAKQLQREEDILTGKLKPPAMQAMLKNAREEIRKKKDEKIYEMRESKNRKEMLRRITNLRKDLVNRIMKPTDRSYVPAELAQSLVDVLDILNMSPTPGTKGAEKYSSVSEAIHKMASAYAKMATQEDSLLKDDFDEDLHGAITALEDALIGLRVQDLSSAEMRDVYDKVKRIRDYLRDANKMIGKENAATIREYGDRIISEQNKIEARKKGYRKIHSLINELTSGAQINALSAMRAIKMIGGWTEDSALYELWKDIENGNEIRSNVVMDSNKTMQPLRTGRNEKTYMNALHNKLDYGIKDTKGKPVKMTKLQAIQLYMTWQREATNDKLSHLQKGLVEIRDANLMIKGKINSAERTAQRFKMTPEIAKKLFDSFTDWDKAYMKAARDVFHRILEDSNKVMYALRHTVMPGDDMYVPIVVDRNYLTTEVNEAEATQIGVKNPGSTKPLENNSTKPVIIDGLDTVLNKHITDMSAYIGLAVPIRNFVKSWNVTSEVSPDEKVSVKDAITKAWGGTANQMMMDVLRQIQNVRSNDYKTGFDRFSQKLAGYFAKSALVGRISVVAKQAASYAAGGSVLSQTALNTAQQYILPIFASPNSKMAQSIYARADRLTPELYNRRQGMSMVEIANERLRGGMIRQAWDKAGASMEQSKIGRGARRALNWLNPYDWIQRMDVATTTALFVACEHQAKMEKLTPNTPEFDSRVRELYNRVIRETQPMYDPLYRNQLQKSKAGGVLQAAFPFKTVPFQNYGQIMDSIGSWQEAMRSGTKEQKTQAAKHMGATIFANFMSALVFAGLTVLGNGVAMHKMKKWRDDDEELTPESFMLQYSKDVGSVMLSNILPYGGSELMEIIERIGTDKNSYFDIFSVGSIELINDTVNSIIKTINKWQDDDASEEDKIQQTAEMIFQVTTMFGMPARNIRDVVNGVKANIQDIRNGNLPAFNNDVDRTNTVNANRYYNAVMNGDTGKAEAVLNEMRANTSGTQKEINQKVRGAINDRVKEAYQSGEMDLDGYISFLENTGLWEPDALADKAAKAVNELYTDGKITEDEAITLLGKYKGMDEDEAWFKVQEWADKNQAVQDALDAGLDKDQAEDVSSSDYRHIYEAIDNNADIGGLVDELTSHGKKRDDVIRAAKDHIVEGYEKGEYDEAKFKNMLSRYCGITKRDEVTDILTKANCYRDTGYRLNNIPSLYKEGDITKDKAKEILRKYGKLSKEDADKKIRWYDLQKSNPDLDITESACNNWYDGTSKSRENGHEGAKAAGMSIETYLKVKAALADVKDANDNGTGEDEYIAALAKLDLTARQKDALYYEKYKGTTKYSKKPW